MGWWLFQAIGRFYSSLARKLNVTQNFPRSGSCWFYFIEWPHIIPKLVHIIIRGDRMECLKWNEVIFLTISNHWKRFNLIRLKALWIAETFGSECGHNNSLLCYRRDQDGLTDESKYWLCWGGRRWLLYRITIVCTLS